MESAYERDIARKQQVRFVLAIFLGALSLGTFFALGLGFIPMDKGDFWVVLVPTAFLTYLVVNMYQKDEMPWHRRYAVVFGAFLLLAVVLIFIRDMGLPSSP